MLEGLLLQIDAVGRTLFYGIIAIGVFSLLVIFVAARDKARRD